MINEADLMQAQKAFMSAPKNMNGATICAVLSAIALDYANGSASNAKLLLDGAKTMTDMMDADL